MSASCSVIAAWILLAGADVAAAADSVRALMECHQDLLAAKYAALKCDRLPLNDAANLASCQSQQREVQKRVDAATARAASCDPDLIHAATLYDRLRILATGGDVSAQRCFITGQFGVSDTSVEFAESELRQDQREQYPALARHFIDDAFRRGDWRVVRWLSATRFYAVDGLLTKAYPFGEHHSETTYRMEYLLMLGSQSDSDGRDARQMVEPWKANQALSARQRAESEAWAHRMYDRHFKNSQDTGTEMCGEN